MTASEVLQPALTVDGPVVAFAGRIASGKSSLARALADHLGARRVSFADYVRLQARGQSRTVGEPPRVLLQKLGEDLASDPVAFCDAVIGSAPDWLSSEPLVVDGIRHVGIWNALQRRFDAGRVLLVYVDSSDVRRESLLRAEGYSAQLIVGMDTHSTEQDVRWDLARLANVVLEEASPEEMLHDLSQQLTELWPAAGKRLQGLTDREPELRRRYRAITSDELVRSDPTGVAEPTRWHDEARIIGFDDGTGGEILVYPEFQFSYDARPHAAMADLVSMFRGAGIGDEGLFSWLIQRNELLEWAPPADELKRRDEVLEAASAYLRGQVPPTPTVTNAVSRSFQARTIVQRWAGMVLDVDSGAWLARLRRLDTGEEALRWFDESEVGEPRSMQQGTTFQWTQLSVSGLDGAALWVVDIDHDRDDDYGPNADAIAGVLAQLDAAIDEPRDLSA